LAAVWFDWARLTRAPEIAFVASAWALSERHGAPLAVAVERAAAALRESRARQRKVRVAVAGPRATVTVLTVLPLTGPAFGLACGIDPATLYLGSRIGALSAALGVGLIVLGRLWCRRMIRKAVA
jgi:Flp pilus assembly protein TadB